MTATATTTIRGVSILTRQRTRHRDVFDLEVSPTGIVILRPGRAPQRMTWDRVSQWELQERAGDLLLTLRGGGAVTPLVVTGWALDDLVTVMQEATSSTATQVPDVTPEPVAPATTVPGESRAARRHRSRRRGRRGEWGWKPVVTVVLLAVLATAVTLVLLQSAGVISWSFLGPTA